MKRLTIRQKRRRRIAAAVLVCLLGIGILAAVCIFWKKEPEKISVKKPVVEEMFLTPNEFSRPGIELKKVKGVVVHYTANPGTDAKDNRNYFEGLKDGRGTYASSHFIIGLDGTIIQCIPLEEIAYASNERNEDTIAIECCHKDKTGAFTKKTYASLVWLTAWLCGEYGLKENQILRHYDITGKACPIYYVEHEKKWEQFKKDVKKEQKKKADSE